MSRLGTALCVSMLAASLPLQAAVRMAHVQQLDGVKLVQVAQAALEAELKPAFSAIALHPVAAPLEVVLGPGVVSLNARAPMLAWPRPRIAVPVDVYVGKDLARTVTIWFAV